MNLDVSQRTQMSAAPLVIRFGALGDLILLTPLLHALHQRYGQPCRLLGSGGWLQPLFEHSRDVGAILQLNSRRRPYLTDPAQWRLVAALRAIDEGPVYVCDHYALPKIRRLLKLAGIAEDRCVYAADLVMASDEHWADFWRRFGDSTPTRYAALPMAARSAGDAIPQLDLVAVDRADLQHWLTQRGLNGKRLILLQPGNKRTLKRGRAGQLNDDKAWPAERWAAVIQRLAAPDTMFVLCGAPAEEGVLKSIQALVPSANVRLAAQDLPLRRLLALLEIASGMISIDTGPAHAAAALGCPLLVLYGAHSPRQWLPRSPTGSVVISLGGPPQTAQVADIGVEQAIEAWQRLRLRG
jgi:ADP-heptose:LPS heptosyltransferase